MKLIMRITCDVTDRPQAEHIVTAIKADLPPQCDRCHAIIRTQDCLCDDDTDVTPP